MPPCVATIDVDRVYAEKSFSLDVCCSSDFARATNSLLQLLFHLHLGADSLRMEGSISSVVVLRDRFHDSNESVFSQRWFRDVLNCSEWQDCACHYLLLGI